MRQHIHIHLMEFVLLEITDHPKTKKEVKNR